MNLYTIIFNSILIFNYWYEIKRSNLMWFRWEQTVLLMSLEITRSLNLHLTSGVVLFKLGAKQSTTPAAHLQQLWSVAKNILSSYLKTEKMNLRTPLNWYSYVNVKSIRLFTHTEWLKTPSSVQTVSVQFHTSLHDYTNRF